MQSPASSSLGNSARISFSYRVSHVVHVTTAAADRAVCLFCFPSIVGWRLRPTEKKHSESQSGKMLLIECTYLRKYHGVCVRKNVVEPMSMGITCKCGDIATTAAVLDVVEYMSRASCTIPAISNVLGGTYWMDRSPLLDSLQILRGSG